jgi:hypothetical protein
VAVLDYKPAASTRPPSVPLSTHLRIAVGCVAIATLLTITFVFLGLLSGRLIWEGAQHFVLEWFPFRVEWTLCLAAVIACILALRRRDRQKGLAVFLIVLSLLWSGWLAGCHHRTLKSVRERNPNWPGWGHF